MAEDLVLRVSQLREALDRVLNFAEQRHGAAIALPGDYYWALPVDAAFDVYQEPAGLTMGSVVDDLAEGLDPNVGDEAVWHELGHLAGLLRALELATR